MTFFSLYKTRSHSSTTGTGKFLLYEERATRMILGLPYSTQDMTYQFLRITKLVQHMSDHKHKRSSPTKSCLLLMSH